MTLISLVNQGLTALGSKRVIQHMKAIFMEDTKPVGGVVNNTANQGSQLRRDKLITGSNPEPRPIKQLIKAEPIDLLDGWQTKYGQQDNVNHTYS